MLTLIFNYKQTIKKTPERYKQPRKEIRNNVVAFSVLVWDWPAAGREKKANIVYKDDNDGDDMVLVIMLMTLMLINKFLESCHFWPVHVSFVSKFADHQIQTYIYTSFCLPEIEHRFSVIMRCIVISQPATIAPFSQKKTLVSLLYY